MIVSPTRLRLDFMFVYARVEGGSILLEPVLNHMPV